MVAAIKSRQNNKHLGFSQNTQNKQKKSTEVDCVALRPQDSQFSVSN